MDRASEVHRRQGWVVDLGLDYLRVARVLDRIDPVGARRKGDEAKELLAGFGGTTPGHVGLYEGNTVATSKPSRAMVAYEAAVQGFTEQAFYPIGLARVFRAISRLEFDRSCSRGGQLGSAQSALEYALAATLLHPYARNAETVANAAFALYTRLGSGDSARKRLRGDLQELVHKALAMREGPFQHLKHLDSCGTFSDVARLVNRALQLAERALEEATQYGGASNHLFRPPQSA
jgi:hypothetical protein